MIPKIPVLVGVAVLGCTLFTGCQSEKQTTDPMTSTPASAPATVATPATAPLTMAMPIRIKAGLSTPLTNSNGTIWLADQNFADGDTVERPDAQIANTTEPAVYQSERYSMTSFSEPVPNGKYTVKLHFCETYDGITGPGQRVFSFNVQGREFKDFDVFAKAGGAFHAYVETVIVEVTDGKLDITFTPNVEHPQINGVEII